MILVLGLSSVFAQVQSESPVLDPNFSHITFETAKTFESPIGIERYQDGNLYIAGQKSLTKLNADGNKIWSNLYGKWFYSCNGIGIDNEGNVYVAVIDYQTWNALVLKYNPQGEVIKTQILSNGFDGPPLGIVFDSKYGRLYVSSYEEIHCLDKNLAFINKQITRDLFPDYGYIYYEVGLDVDNSGNVYVGGYKSGWNKSRYVGLKYAPQLSGLLWSTIGEIEPALDYLSDMVARPEGGMYIVGYEYDDNWNEEISVNYFTDSGAIGWKTNFFGWTDVTGLATDEVGNIYIGATFYDYSAAQLVKLDGETGKIAWRKLDPYGWSFTQSLVDEQDRVYAVGWPMEYVPGEDLYISRYLQGGQEDTTAPKAITDLEAINVSTDTITLEWTAPGDDGDEGTANSYDIRYTTVGFIISNMVFSSATQVSGVSSPQIAGSTETFTVTGLNMGTTYYFAIKTKDEAENISDLSNAVAVKTLGLYGIVSKSPETQIVTVGSTTAPMTSLVNVFNTTNPVSGIRVDFSISTYPIGSIGHELSKSSETTKAGLADVQLRLGDIPAEYGVMATCPDCIPSASTVTFKCCGKLKNDDFKQFDSRWKSEHYDNLCSTSPAYIKNRPVYSCDDPIFNNKQYTEYKFSIRAKGCGLTAFATVINYYKEAYSLPISSTTPFALNTYLKDNSGYGTGKYRGAVLFSEVLNISDSPDSYVDFLGKINICTNRKCKPKVTRNDLIKTINKDLSNNNPVIIRVYGHFMLVIGKCGAKYIVSDPGSGHTGLYDPNGNRKLIGIRQFRLIKKP